MSVGSAESRRDEAVAVADRELAGELLHWADFHGITTSTLEKYPVVAERLVGSPARTPFGSKPSLARIERILELRHGDAHRKSYGTYYTPRHVVDYLVREAHVLSGGSQAPSFVDPACGSGAFLVGAASYLHHELGLPAEEVLLERVAGVDVDPTAVSNSQLMLQLLALEWKARIDVRRARILRADSVLGDPQRLLHQLGQPRGFTILSTNPPYVKLQTLELPYRDALRARFGTDLSGSFSLALAFLMTSRALLADGGVAGFITLNNLISSVSAEPVRRRLGAHLARLVDFGHERVFTGVGAYTALVFVSQTPRSTFEFARVEGNIEVSLRERRNLSALPTRLLDAKKWRLAEQPHFDNLRKLEGHGDSVGDIASIRVGFATLKDSVYFLNPVDETPAAQMDGQRLEIEQDMVRPAIQVASLRTESVTTGDMRWLIFPYRPTATGFRLIEEAELRAYPAAYRFLCSNRDVLSARDKGLKRYPAWYAWGRTQGLSAPGPKLLTKTFDRRPTFRLDESDAVFCNGYSISLKANSVWTLAGLKRVLQSRFMHYYARLTSFQIAGGYQCYQKNFIERFALPSGTSLKSIDIIEASEGDLEAWLADWYGIPQSDLDAVVPTTTRLT